MSILIACARLPATAHRARNGRSTYTLRINVHLVTLVRVIESVVTSCFALLVCSAWCILQTNPETGLPLEMVAMRRSEFGFNELPEKYVHPLIKFLSYFILPMPLMIWAAIIIELIKACVTGEGWEDFVVLMILQFANGTVGFVEELNAGNAVAALKAKLTPECYVCRAGEYVPCVAVCSFPFDELLAPVWLYRPPRAMRGRRRCVACSIFHAIIIIIKCIQPQSHDHVSPC